MTTLDETGPAGVARPSDNAVHCPGCRHAGGVRFHRIVDQPVHVGVTYRDAALARCAPLGEIDLCYCHGCGLVFNAAFDPRKLDYTPGYDASLTSSAMFLRCRDATIDHLIDRYQLAGKTVVEVGCGAGHFLRRLCSRAGCDGIGIDPAVPEEGQEPCGDSTLTWIRSVYGAAHAGLPCDLLCGLDMFEHLHEPGVFLQALRMGLPAAGGTPVYFESPDRRHVFEGGAGWSVYYEQCVHYDAGTMRATFERMGFEVVAAGPCAINPQCLGIEAVVRPADECMPAGIDDGPDAGRGLPANLAVFDSAQRQRVRDWAARLSGWTQTGREVVLWGSGGKGINFLNTVPGAERIRRVVDINPARQGRYLPRAAQQVVAPSALIDSPPSIVVVSNPLWGGEIAATIDQLGLDCELVNA